MKKLIIAGAVIAAVSTFAVSAFAADTSSDTAETSGSSAAFCTQTECTQFLCPQDGTGNRYGADDDKASSVFHPAHKTSQDRAQTAKTKTIPTVQMRHAPMYAAALSRE